MCDEDYDFLSCFGEPILFYNWSVRPCGWMLTTKTDVCVPVERHSLYCDVICDIMMCSYCGTFENYYIDGARVDY